MRACPRCGLQAGDDVIFCPKDGARLAGEEDSAEVKARLSDPLVGATVVGRYKVVRRIGEGGMGVVYEAEHIALGKHVALKVLRDDFTRKADLVERFKQEARSASIIGHENIIDVSDFGITEGGGIFFAMELLRGEDLADVLQRETRLPLDRTVRIVGQMCRALHAAHQKGIIHRDLKPENVFLVQKEERRDVVKVLDFGIAKMTTLDAEGRRLTQTGVIFGTPEYMAPEQARGQTLDLRVDIYATGVMLYEMLAGQVPFTGESFMAILTQHLFSEPRPLSVVAPDVKVPKAIESVIVKAMSKDRDERYATMLEMYEDLQRAVAGDAIDLRASTLPPITGQRPSLTAMRQAQASEDSLTQPPAVGARTRTPSRRLPIVLVVVLVLLAGGAAAAYFMWQAGYFGGGEEAGKPPASAADAGLVAVGPADRASAAAPLDAAAGEATAAESGVTVPAEGEAGGEAAADVGAIEAVGDAVPDAPPAAPGEAAADGQAPADDVGTAAAKVRVTIETDPSGARLYDGRGRRLCRTPTPCTVEAALGTTLQLHAEKGMFVGDDVFPVVPNGSRRYTMTLRRPIGPPPRDAGGTTPQPDSIFTLRRDAGLPSP